MEAFNIFKSLRNSRSAKKCLDALISENPNDYLLRVMKGILYRLGIINYCNNKY